MSMFLKEEAFLDYLRAQFPGEVFQLGYSVISINVVHLNPIMSCVYMDQNKLVAAKYNRQLEIFTDALLVPAKKIKTISLLKKGLNYQLVVETTEQATAQHKMTLTLNLSPLTGTKWHKKNLQQLQIRIQAQNE